MVHKRVIYIYIYIIYIYIFQMGKRKKGGKEIGRDIHSKLNCNT